MIVKSLPHLDEGQPVNAASLYKVYTNLWVQRDYRIGRVVLNPDTKLTLMMELAWRMWADEKTTFSTAALLSFVSTVHAGKAVDFGDQEVDDIVGEVRAASFLRRSRTGDEWHFMHRSFAEFFLARKILDTARQGREAMCKVLNTRRLDRKVIYFLTLLDDAEALRGPLQDILTSPYTSNVSENALQILYWSGRIRCDMEDKVEDVPKLRQCLGLWIPPHVQLHSAQLQEAVFEAAPFVQADFSSADLTKANLNRTVFEGCCLDGAILADARGEEAVLTDCRAQGVVLTDASVSGSFLRACTLAAGLEDAARSGASTARTRGLYIESAGQVRDLEAVVQLGSSSVVTTVAFSREAGLLAAGGGDGIVRLYRMSDGRLLRTLEGHQNGVRSVSFDPTGRTLASGSWDQTVKLWESSSGKLLRTLEGHQNGVSSVSFDPTGRTLASGSDDNTVKLWESSSGKLLATLAGHLGPVASVSFGAQGKYLVAAGSAGRLQFWDLDCLSTFLCLYTFGPGARLALLPDGRFDGTPEALRYLCYTERGTCNSFTAEELVKEFHDPKAVQEVLAKYTA